MMSDVISNYLWVLWRVLYMNYIGAYTNLQNIFPPNQDITDYVGVCSVFCTLVFQCLCKNKRRKKNRLAVHSASSNCLNTTSNECRTTFMSTWLRCLNLLCSYVGVYCVFQSAITLGIYAAPSLHAIPAGHHVVVVGTHALCLRVLQFESRPQNVFAINLWQYGVFGDGMFLTKVTYLFTSLRRFFPVAFCYHKKTNT